MIRISSEAFVLGVTVPLLTESVECLLHLLRQRVPLLPVSNVEHTLLAPCFLVHLLTLPGYFLSVLHFSLPLI